MSEADVGKADSIAEGLGNWGTTGCVYWDMNLELSQRMTRMTLELNGKRSWEMEMELEKVGRASTAPTTERVSPWVGEWSMELIKSSVAGAGCRCR